MLHDPLTTHICNFIRGCIIDADSTYTDKSLGYNHSQTLFQRDSYAFGFYMDVYEEGSNKYSKILSSQGKILYLNIASSLNNSKPPVKVLKLRS